MYEDDQFLYLRRCGVTKPSPVDVALVSELQCAHDRPEFMPEREGRSFTAYMRDEITRVAERYDLEVPS